VLHSLIRYLTYTAGQTTIYNLQSIATIYIYNRCLLFRVIYSSHPSANTIMLVGIIVCFLAVLCIGVDGRFVTPWQFLIVCQARAWTMSVGFTLAFGAMFSKVWRVHRLSTKAKADQGKVSRIYLIRIIGSPLIKRYE